MWAVVVCFACVTDAGLFHVQMTKTFLPPVSYKRKLFLRVLFETLETSNDPWTENDYLLQRNCWKD